MIVNLRGGKTAEVDFGHVHSKHLTITGARLRPRSIAEKSAICRALEQHVWPKFATGQITPQTFAVFPFTEAAKAHQLMESSIHIGKIILNYENIWPMIYAAAHAGMILHTVCGHHRTIYGVRMILPI